MSGVGARAARGGARALLALAMMVIGSLVLWVGVPIGWLWIGSQIQAESGSVGAAIGVMLAGVVVSVLLLAALVGARGRVLTRDQLMDKAMGTDVFVTDRAIDVHITAIRKKLGSANWLVHTVRGVGYRLQETPGEGE